MRAAPTGRAGAALLATATAALVLLVGTLLHVRLVPVLSGSMAPGVPVGALVVTTPIAVRDVAVGDVLAFGAPSPYAPRGARPVLHRVTSLEERDGRALARTRGDANPVEDPWTLDLAASDPHLARAVVPLLGRLAAPLHSTGPGPAAAVVVGFLLLGLGLLTRPRRGDGACP